MIIYQPTQNQQYGVFEIHNYRDNEITTTSGGEQIVHVNVIPSNAPITASDLPTMSTSQIQIPSKTIPAGTKYLPTATKSLPASSKVMPTSEISLIKPTQQPPVSRKQMPVASKFIPTSQEPQQLYYATKSVANPAPTPPESEDVTITDLGSGRPVSKFD